MKKTSVLYIFLILMTISTVNALTDCNTITSDTILENDIYASSVEDPCITFGTNNITLDCQGYKIISTGSNYGIYAENKNSITIKNCEIEGFNTDTKLENCNNFLIKENKFNNRVALSLGSMNNNIQNNEFYESIVIDGPSNTITQNTFSQNTHTSSIILSAQQNTITNNTFTSVGIGMAISNLEGASYNIISENTIINYGVGIWLGAIFSEAIYNNVTFNTLTDNTYAIRIFSGDLNLIHNNTINYTEGKDSRESENFGFDLDNSENNIMYNNELELQNNYYDIDFNLYCFNGENNTYKFNITEDCIGDCIVPNCTEVLDEGEGWGGGGDDKGDPLSLLSTTSLLQKAGWTNFNIENAIRGKLLYHTPTSSDNYRYWRIHTTNTLMKVEFWKFEHQYSHIMSNNAKIIIRHKNGDTVQYIDLTTPGNEWIHLGDFEFDDTFLQGVAVFPGPEGITIADAIRIESIA